MRAPSGVSAINISSGVMYAIPVLSTAHCNTNGSRRLPRSIAGFGGIGDGGTSPNSSAAYLSAGTNGCSP